VREGVLFVIQTAGQMASPEDVPQLDLADTAAEYLTTEWQLQR
jgi:hypothetical protein